MRGIKRLFRLLPGFLVMGLTLWVLLFFILAPSLPDTDRLWRDSSAPAITLLDRHGRVIATKGGAGRRPVQLSELPAYVGQAVIAIEDRRFYRHFGFDFIGFARAIITNIKSGGLVQGGSTISQQLAKNLFLNPKRSIRRKIEELILAIWLEARLEKDEILALYLNRVYFGAGAYGIDAAARRYFDKSARALSIPEAAMMAGLLKAPSVLAPTNNIKRARARAGLVLDRMVDEAFISQRQGEEAKTGPARLAPRLAREAGYFVDLALARAQSKIGRPSRDLVLGTTLDLDIQREVEHAVNRIFERELIKDSPLETALVVIDRTGAIRGLLGGRFYHRSSYNRALYPNRQVGSAFKPLVYLAGLETGMTPETIIDDAPVTVEGWTPRNTNGQYAGRISMEQALARSANAATVRLSNDVGLRSVMDAARRLGIERALSPHPSIALGTAQVSVLEMARAYAPFAFEGNLPVIHLLDQARHGDEPSIQFQTKPPASVIDRRHAAQMTRMLKAVVRSGSGRAAAASGCDAAGKTGTTQQARDAWFVGYCDGYLAAVWVGFDDNKPMRGVSGGGLPAKIWAEVFKKLPDDQPKPQPEQDPSASLIDNEGVEWLVDRLLSIIQDVADR